MSDLCSRLRVLVKTLDKAIGLLEESLTRTPVSITSYSRMTTLSNLIKSSYTISMESLRDVCQESLNKFKSLNG